MDSEIATDEATETETREERVLRCARCGQGIASERDVFGVGGADAVQVFANPGGWVWEIVTLRDAPGALVHGRPTTEFTWFPGYAWRFAACGRCGQHLGWRYDGPQEPPSFFGLIRDRLA